MIPAEIVLSPETHQQIVEESNFQPGLEAKKDPVSALKGAFLNSNHDSRRGHRHYRCKRTIPKPLPGLWTSHTVSERDD